MTSALRPLRERLTDAPLDLSTFFRLAQAICEAVSELHRRDAFHGAIHPGSLLVDSGGHVQLSAPSSVAAPGPRRGRAEGPVAAYMSPEQTGRINRTVDYRTDHYSLGVTFYEMLAGRRPFLTDDPLELVHAHIARTPPALSSLRPEIPDAVSRIVVKLLSKEASDRYQSVYGLSHDLARCDREWTSTGTVMPFELGQHDVADRFLIPQRLYGREREVADLLTAFDAACGGGNTLLLVAGYSGIGKTSLINELYKPIVRQRGCFLSGKSDQVVRNIPYGALIQAFRSLIWVLLTESEGRLAAWKERLTTALGANGGVIAEVIPEIELIIGIQPAPPPLEPAEAQNRFRYVFQNFVGALAARDHPLVVFLDDLQWVDAATLDLLHALLTAPDIRHLLFVCAYRDNEVDAGHLVSWAIGRIEAAGADVRSLPLAPLGLTDLLPFVCDTLHTSPADTRPLAELIQQKTDGNPFFVIQFLKTLHQEGFLTFDRPRGCWTFRLDAIGRAGVTDNVVDLMTRRIRRLSEGAQRVLTLAACIGNTFEWLTLVTVSRQSAGEVSAALAESLDAGLVQQASEPYDRSDARSAALAYAFVHDRVQQAAYGLIPDAQRKPVHLEIGRLLRAGYDGDAGDDRIFSIVNHLNMGAELIDDEAERISVARLNLTAGRKAKTSAAYQAACHYLDAGRARLTEEHWGREYDLMVALQCEAAECRYLSGDFDGAEGVFGRLLARALAPTDRAQIHGLLVTLSEHRSRWADAIAHGCEGLAAFGIVFPRTAEGKTAALDREVDAVQRALGGRAIASLVDLPEVGDPETRVVMRLLTILWAPAYISGDQVLARLISATLVRLSLEHGHTGDSAYGYVTHAITVGPIRRDYAAAYEWGQLALRVNDRFGDVKRRAKIQQQFQAHVNLWRRPFATCIPYAREACRSGLETGDFTYAGYGAATEAWPALLVNRSLEGFVRDFSPHLALLARVRMTAFSGAHQAILNWARALQGLTAGRLSLTDPSFDERAFVAEHETSAPFFLTFVYTARLHLGVLYGEHELALASARRARDAAPPGTMWPVLIDYWGGLAMAGVYPRAAAEDQRVYRAQFEATQTSLAELSRSCPENFRCFWLILSAEIVRVTSEGGGALTLYEEAINYARETGNLQQEALASELCGRMCMERGQDGIAAAFLAGARRCYAEWGATAKVAHLDQMYEHLIGAGARPETAAGAGPAPVASETSLDMATVLKMARAIAVEIERDGLLRALITLAVENAGAERGVFLEAQDSSLVVEAEAVSDGREVTVRQAVPLAAVEDLPHSVIRYVQRTGQDVVLGSASSDERFASDTDVTRRQLKSLLCIPVSHQGRLGGVLYLENNLTTEAFTPDRLEMMHTLAAQAAISLENARLYEATKTEVARRTAAEAALRAAMNELEGLKNRLEAENVYLQEEIRTQHNFNEIVGSSPALLEALRKVERVAPTESTVLIVGETGSGKELFARAVHSRSRRNDRPLVKVNCGAIAPGLVESELFGHVKGAFTGAIEKRVGRFEVANGGTIFLDEVGELPLEAQVKLLRVLQEQEFEPVGSSRTVRVNIRVIAATNRNLDEAVREGKFRADLLYRLNVFPIAVPPLRERGADIRLLAGFFAAALSRKLGKPIQGFSARSMEWMMGYSWPGNVRELQNIVERAAILAQGAILEVERAGAGAEPALPVPEIQEVPAPASLDDAQRAHILRVLRATGGVVEGARGAATVLGLHPNTLRSRMKKLGITASPR